jgi:hypothetical protein
VDDRCRPVAHAPDVPQASSVLRDTFPDEDFLCGQLDVIPAVPNRPAQGSSVSLEDTGEPSHHDSSQEPASETEPKGPPGGVAMRDEGISLLEVGDRQEQVEGVAGRVEPGLFRPALGRAQVGWIGVVKHKPSDHEQPN